MEKRSSRRTEDLLTNKTRLEREIMKIDNKIEDIDVEERERIELMKERDLKIQEIAEKHQLKNVELMKNSKYHVLFFLL